MDHLRETGQVHEGFEIQPRPDWRCYDSSLVLDSEQRAVPVELPKLFSLYMRFGAKVCGPPAIDRSFKTIDYLVVLDLDDLSPDTRATFFS
jgi:putative hemolysin